MAACKIARRQGTRVCQRTVVLAVEAWLALQSDQHFGRDALAPLRRIQQDLSMSFPVRQETEGLSTTITMKNSAPLTTAPIDDAQIIIVDLIAMKLKP
ncbi:MAG: hypothetical protein NPIRA03_16670 [Nitrospirales bacterium]|nr:MAG: hypothetical protein NPIRA03_16670 [Nitrospirales bacterium]